MSMVNDKIMRRAEQRRGLVTTTDLQSLGFDHRGIGRLVDRCVIHPIKELEVPSVFAVGPDPLDFQQQALAVCLQDPRLTISHGAAAQLWHLRRMTRNLLEVTATHDHPVSIPGLAVHRSNRLYGRDVAHRIDGMRLTSPARVLFDLAGTLDMAALRSVTEDALNRQLTTPEAMHDLGARLLGRGRRGGRMFRELLEMYPGSVPVVGSDDELQFEVALQRAGLHPVRQHPILLPGGREVRLDFAFIPEKVDVEIDHWHWHGDRAAQQQDKARDATMATIGWLALRFTDDDARGRIGACVATVRDVVELRAKQLGLGRTA